MLDEVHEELPRKSGDDNLYTLGSIGAHNVVIVCLPMGIMGTNCAAAVTKDLRRSFESIEFGVMVGIGGGIPTKVDIRLGDVAVSKPDGQHGGVVQYDFGKTVDYGHPLRVGTLNKPHPLLLGAASTLAARHREGDPEFHKHIEKMVESRPELNSDAVYPGEQSDQLFDATYQHESRFSTCDQCDPCRVTPRQPRMVKSPVIHYGNIASGNQVMRDATTRDQLAHQENVICFEMEAAGFMDRLPCLVVRGICDYADSHKNKKWQPYAAVVAAAYAKELLLIVQPLTALDVKEDRRDRENRMETMKTWVSPLDFYKHETAIFNGTFEAGQWLIEDPIFKGWKSKARMPAEIYCEGGHGSGKVRTTRESEFSPDKDLIEALT